MTDEKEDKYKLLIVDDVPKNIQVVANILQTHGYSMAFAQSGETALELAATNDFDLVLLDIMMPGMDGFEVCERFRRNPATHDIPVLFLTAKTDTESLLRGFEVGAMDYVTKPVNEAELVARVKTHLRLYRYRLKLMAANKQLSREIEDRQEAVSRYKDMYHNAVQGMFQSTLEGRIITLNPAYTHILGYDSQEEVLSIKNVAEAFYARPEERETMIDVLKQDGKLTNYELKIRRKDGMSAWVMINSRLTQDRKGEPIIEGVVIDITAQKQAEEKIRRSRENFKYQATHDNLTGLYNTRYLYRALDRLISQSTVDNTPVSLIFMDVDNFKHVVDTYGHLKGSQTLREMARTIRDRLTEPAYGVAYGGDEFVVVLPGYGKALAIAKAEEIRTAIRETPYLTDKGHEVYISASFGIAGFPDDAKDANGLLALADQAMFDVKDEGKDAVRATVQ